MWEWKRRRLRSLSHVKTNLHVWPFSLVLFSGCESCFFDLWRGLNIQRWDRSVIFGPGPNDLWCLWCESKAEELQEYIRDFSMDSKNQPTNCFPPSVEEFILLSCFYLCVTNEDLHGPVAVLINNVYNLLWASGVLSDAKQHKQRRSSKVLHHSLSVSRTRLVLVNTGGHNNLKLSSEVPLW